VFKSKGRGSDDCSRTLSKRERKHSLGIGVFYFPVIFLVYLLS
jgi:hypothetical protein